MDFSVRAAELTTLLESRITNFYTNFQVDEIGRVVSVGDGIARVYGLNEIQAGEMVEFAPIFLSLVISLLVSLILLGLIFLYSQIKSQTTRKWTLFHADLLSFLFPLCISIIFLGLGIPIPIAYCADGDEAGPSHEGGNDPQIPFFTAPSPVEILLIPESPPVLSPQYLLPSIEEGGKVATQVRKDHSQKPSFFIPEIPPYRGKDLEVQPPSEENDENPLAVEEAQNRVISSFRALYKASLEETPPSFIKCKRLLSKEAFSMETLVSLKAELTRGDPNSSAFTLRKSKN